MENHNRDPHSPSVPTLDGVLKVSVSHGTFLPKLPGHTVLSKETTGFNFSWHLGQFDTWGFMA